MTIIYVDTETRSPVPINHGTARYHTKSEIITLQYAVGDSEVVVVDCTAPTAQYQLDKFVAIVEGLILSDEFEYFLAHNAYFDRNAPRNAPWFPAEQRHPRFWRCSMATALAHGLPGGLDKLSEIYKLGDESKLEGKALIHLFCKPQKNGQWATRETHQAEWKEFLRYAEFDIHSMRKLWRMLPKWNLTDTEVAVWHLDQVINDRGIAVDVEFAQAAIRATTRAKKELDEQTMELTDGELDRATRRDAMLEWILGEHGIALPDLKADTVEKRLNDPELPEDVKELLRIRQQATKASTAKYKRVLQSEVDGRLRGLLQYCAANRTGRWGGRIFQPQNLPRPKHKQHEIDLAIDAMKGDYLHLLTDNVMGLASSALRGLLIAAPGNKLCISDLSNIEGRVLPWISGEDWKLEAFANFDAGIGEDMYKTTYGRMFSIDPKDVTKDQRQQGKGVELSMGYQGWIGAFLNIAATYGLDLDELTAKALPVLPKQLLLDGQQSWHRAQKSGKHFDLGRDTYAVCQSLALLWREAHPMTVHGWKAAEDAAHAAIAYPGKAMKAVRCTFIKEGAWLRIILPSGRSLCYPHAKREDGTLSYYGVNVYRKSWHRIYTYGGKLIENIVQAISRDILADAILRIEPKMPVVLTVHDEVICEVPADSALGHEDLSRMLATNPAWATGLPLAAAGFETTRYRKD